MSARATSGTWYRTWPMPPCPPDQLTGEPVEPLAYLVGAQALEERSPVRAAGLREQHLAAEPRQQLGELLRVPRLVEEVGAEDELPRAPRAGAAPARPSARARPGARSRSAPRCGAGARPRPPPSRSRGRRRRGARPRATAGRDRSRARGHASRPGRGRRRARASATPLGHSSAQYGRNSSSSKAASSISSSALGGRRSDSTAPGQLELVLDEVQSAGEEVDRTPSGSRSCA